MVRMQDFLQEKLAANETIKLDSNIISSRQGFVGNHYLPSSQFRPV